jgi:hypothetical protein
LSTDKKIVKKGNVDKDEYIEYQRPITYGNLNNYKFCSWKCASKWNQKYSKNHMKYSVEIMINILEFQEKKKKNPK